MALTAGSHPQNKQSTRQLGERQTGAGTSSICSCSAQPPDLQPTGVAVQPPAGLGREELEVLAGCAQGSARGVSQVDCTQLCCLGQPAQIFIISMDTIVYCPKHGISTRIPGQHPPQLSCGCLSARPAPPAVQCPGTSACTRHGVQPHGWHGLGLAWST